MFDDYLRRKAANTNETKNVARQARDENKTLFVRVLSETSDESTDRTGNKLEISRWILGLINLSTLSSFFEIICLLRKVGYLVWEKRSRNHNGLQIAVLNSVRKYACRQCKKYPWRKYQPMC